MHADAARARRAGELAARSERKEPSALVLLREFAERFDRTFLPVAEVAISPR